MRYLLSFFSRLWILLALSSAPTAMIAHEVLPTIANFETKKGVLEFEIKLNLEAQLAGINLDRFSDTDNADNASAYNALRAEPNIVVAGRATQLLTRWNALPMIVAPEGAVPLTLVESVTEDVADPDLPRMTTITLSGELPAGAQTIKVSWPAGSGAMILRQHGTEDPYTGFIESGGTSPEIDLKGGDTSTGWQVFAEYIPVGFDHIVPKGLDHILFVLGLFFLSVRLAPLLWQVSAFTLAHTVTLALGALGWVNIPGSIVEPLIAASIVYVAVENIIAARMTPWRPAVVFGLGLLHGLGFASVLGDFGLPDGQFIPALIGFNIGVEFGQLAVIGVAFLLVGYFVNKDWYRKAIAIPASLVIGLVGAYWVVERTIL